MSAVELTASQRDAVEAKRHVAVVAGAGSGKTRVLVERYLELLSRDSTLRPGNLLAITFTNRAASEMKRRLRERLRSIAAGTEGIAAQARACLDDFHHAAVMTIHAFAAEVLRAHPFEAQLDPGFDVADEMAARGAREEIAERLLQDIDAAPADHGLRPAALPPLRAWGHRRTLHALRGLLSRERTGDEQWDRLAAQTPEAALRHARDLWTKEVGLAARRILREPEAHALVIRGARLVRDHMPAECADLPIAAWPAIADALEPDQIRPADSPRIDELLRILLTGEGEPRKKPHHSAHGKKGLWGDALYAELGQIIVGLGSSAAALRDIWIPWDEAHEREAAALLSAMARLVVQARAQLARRKDAEGWLDFDDLLLRASRLVAAEPERVAQALAHRFHAILIDEFQDTDPTQWRLVQSLLAASGGHLPVMIVGDPRQSIYRFRGAEVRVFDEAAHHIESTSAGAEFLRQPLDENFRAVPALVHAVNGIFAPLLPRITADTAAPMAPPALIPASKSAPWPGALILHFVAGKRGEEALRAEAESVAAAISAIVRSPDRWSAEIWQAAERPPSFSPRWRDVAILVRQMTHLDVIENALRAANVPFHTGGGAGLARRQEIRDLGHLLRFLAEPTDDLALLGLLRTPWMGWSDDLLMKVSVVACGLEPRDSPPLWERIRRLRRRERHGVALPDEEWNHVLRTRELLSRAIARAHLATPGEVAHEILTGTGAWGLVRMEPEGRRRLANLRRGLERVRQMDAGGFESILAAAEALERLTEDEARVGEEQLLGAGEDAVALLTIHAAKGLEFPIVVLPQMQALHMDKTAQGDWTWDDSHGLGLRAPNPSEDWRSMPATLMRVAVRREQRESEAEAARVLYVAMTRAERMLILSGAIPGSLEEAMAGDRRCDLTWILGALQPAPDALAQKSISPPWAGAEQVSILTPERCLPLAPAREAGALQEIHLSLSPEARAAVEPLPERQDVARPVSITALSQFAHCPNRVVIGNLDLAPDWNGHGEIRTSTGGDALTVGSLFHRCVERHRADLGAAMDATVEEFFNVRGEELNAEAARRVSELIERLRALPIAEAMRSADEAFAEFDVVVMHREGPLRGRLDLLMRHGNIWEIVDFKTGAHDPGEDALRAEHRVQMLCYLLFLAGHAPKQEIFTVRAVFPALGREIVFSHTREELAAISAEIGELIRRFKIESGRPRRVAHPCAGCPSPSLCRSL